MYVLRTGTRLQSQVCETQVIVVRSSAGLDNLRAGGVAMVALGEAGDSSVTMDSAFSGGSVLGKRYVADDGAEVLVTRGGAGTLSIGDTPLTIKSAQPLPASD
jgi:hypothetical protein